MATTSPFGRFVPDLTRTLLRFPTCAAASVVLCIVNNVEAAEGGTFDDHELWQINCALIAAFLAGGAGHLFGESHRWSRLKSLVPALGLATAAGALTYFETVTETHHLFVLGGLILALMVSAHLRSGASQNAVWLFNARLGLAAVLSVIIGLIFAGGLSTIVASLNYLFDAEIDRSAHEHIWTVGVALIGPIYGLTLVPADLDEELTLAEDGNVLERGVAAIINYVLVPLAVAYAAILHLYAIKVGWAWELPKGQIGTMVMLFGFGSAATYLIARPWAERGTALLKWFLASWFWFVIVPSVMLALAVWTRISDYGVTPERYGLALVFLWLILVAAYLAARRSHADSRVIIAVLSALLLAASVGPWSARSISLSSQMSRLTDILQSFGYLKDGRLLSVLPRDENVSVSIAASARSIIDFLRHEDELARLQPFFEGRENSPFEGVREQWKLVRDINKQLNVHHEVQYLEDRERIDYTAAGPHRAQAKPDMILSGPLQFQSNHSPGESNGIKAYVDGQSLVIEHAGREWRMPSIDLLKAAKAHPSKTDGPPGNLQHEVAGGGGSAVLLFNRVSGYLGTADTSQVYATFWVLLPAT